MELPSRAMEVLLLLSWIFMSQARILPFLNVSLFGTLFPLFSFFVLVFF
uniref:Uncharacterized protein n=1 Tax=Rhizophora mucronata TaxID=61149 RepID=A0A2P2MGE9_RHIMU